MSQNGLAQIKALIRFYFKSEPQKLEDVFHEWSQLKFALLFEGKLKITEIKTA